MTGTRQILFIQGGGAGTHDEWDNKLVESLRQAPFARHQAPSDTDWRRRGRTHLAAGRACDRADVRGSALHGCARGPEVPER
jgi:hypothetical protein